MLRSIIVFFVSALLLSGCGFGNFGNNLSTAVLSQNDPILIRDGLPSYLIFLDAMLVDDPDDEDKLKAAANLYLLYGSLFVENNERSKRLIDRARDYSSRALCEIDDALCDISTIPFDRFEWSLNELDDDDVPFLFTATASWLAWIQVHSDDWNAIAGLPRVELALQKILALDEMYMDGSAHIYLGILKSLRPPALGGKPKESEFHFLRAIEISDGKNLGAKVEYARRYARGIYDQELHDRLLKEVLTADPDVEGRTLMNILAQKTAQSLLDSAEDYF